VEAGLTFIETNVSAETVSPVCPEVLPKLAMIVVVPAEMPDAWPLVEAELPTVAASGFSEVQVTCSVMFWLEPSEKLPIAVKESVNPAGRTAFAGVTTIPVSAAVVTVIVVPPETPLDESVEVTEVEPMSAALTRPLLPDALLTSATAGFAELQVTVVVKSIVLPSE
jgi:hypothetical protein